MSSEAETLLQELLKEFPTLQIEIVNGTICVNIERHWYSSIVTVDCDGNLRIDEDARKLVANYVVFKEVEAKVIKKMPERRGEYLVVHNANLRCLHKTEDSALRSLEGCPHSFSGRIGCGEFEEDILILSTIEKPHNFDNIDNRTVEFTFKNHRGFHVNGSRRWLEVSLHLAGGAGFRREYFLLDTGSPKSIIIDEVVNSSSCGVVASKRNYIGNLTIEVEGVETEFEVQKWNDGDDRTKNINLLGTNFLNNFVLMDDYVADVILVLKRALISVIHA